MYFLLFIKKESSSETIQDNLLSFMHKSGFNILWLRSKLVKSFTMINMHGKNVLRWVICFLNYKINLTSLLQYKRVKFKSLLLTFNNTNETWSHWEQSPQEPTHLHLLQSISRTSWKYSNTNKTLNPNANKETQHIYSPPKNTHKTLSV